MIGYAMVGTNDLAKAKAFYDALLGEMGAKVLMDVGRAAFYGTTMGQPMFGICVPYNQEAASPGKRNIPRGERRGGNVSACEVAIPIDPDCAAAPQ